MPTMPRATFLDQLFYEAAAREYCRSRPLEQIMEATAQATQRKITLESFDLIRVNRPDVHCFNELLIQYPTTSLRAIGRVVPDNMVVIHTGPIHAETSFNIPFEDARPFMVMEYVSELNKRKDYEDNMRRYEAELRIPYYLIFEPDKKQLLLFRLNTRKKYGSVKPNMHGRLDVPELDLDVAILDGWVRYWLRGRLLPLPADLARELEESKKRTRQAEKRAADAERIAADAKQRADTAEQRAEVAEETIARLQAELKRLRGGA
jgi:Uma2 family endonuclease